MKEFYKPAVMQRQAETGVLYWESHVTIEPVFDDERLKRLEGLCKPFGFKVANLLFQKRAEDTPERNKSDTFTSARSPEREALLVRMVRLIGALQVEGFMVWRYKIEAAVIDSKYDDAFGLLNTKA
jgi:hypothetical protein